MRVRSTTSSNYLTSLNASISLANNNTGVGSVSRTLTGEWASPIEYESLSAWADVSKAFFVAPTTANYTFVVAGDDFVMLNGTWIAVRFPTEGSG